MSSLTEQNNIKTSKQRIEWIDFYKALAIVLVVVGHTTGKLNQYIYQFHMPAFFFISGYCFSWKGISKIKIIWNKIYSLLFPLWTIFIIGAFAMAFLYRMGIYQIFWEDSSYIGFGNIIKNYVQTGSNYVWWMGATWFIQVLFLIIFIWSILLSFIEKIGIKNDYCLVGLMLFISVFFYFFGMSLKDAGVTYRGADLVFIGQVFFCYGIITRIINFDGEEKNTRRDLKSLIIYIIAAGLSLYIMKLFANNPGTTMDFPSRSFQKPLMNLFLGANGIILVYAFSHIFDIISIRIKPLRKIVIFLGQNTISVVFFHFLMFKLVFVLLHMCGVMPADHMVDTTPFGDLGWDYLPLFLCISFGGSIALWKLLTCVSYGRLLLGEDKEFRGKVGSLINRITERIKRPQALADLTYGVRDILKDGVSVFKNYVLSNKIQAIFLSIMTVCAFCPLWNKGIILNDELVMRSKRMRSLFTLLTYNVKNEFRMGRILRIPAGFNEAFGLLTKNMKINNIIQTCILVIGVIVFSYMVKKILCDSKIAIFSGILVVATLPITFEHAAPNAFVGLVTMPLIYLCLSLTGWVEYLRTDKRSNLLVSMFFLILALTGYEYVVTYIPLYVLILWGVRHETKNALSEMIKKSMPPIVIGSMYVLITFGYQKVATSVYAGASVGFVSLKSSFEIIRVLLRSAIPGYYLTNAKYQYLTYYYTGETYKELFQFVEKPISSIKNPDSFEALIEFLVKYAFKPRILITACLASILLFLLLNKKSARDGKRLSGDLYIVLCIAVYTILPTLPNAVAGMYQGQVTENFFTSLPVSLNLSFTMALLIAYILVRVSEYIQVKQLIGFVSMVFFILVMGVQTMSGVISNEQSNNYKRLLEIERLMETDCISGLENTVIFTPDIGETRNLLAAPISYWNQQMADNERSISFIEEDASQATYELYYINDDYFCLSGDNTLVLLSDERLDDGALAMTSEDGVFPVSTGEFKKDHGFYKYNIEKEEQK